MVFVGYDRVMHTLVMGYGRVNLPINLGCISLSPYGHLPAFLSRVFWMIDLVSNSPTESISRRRFENF